jgi:hypothetical protein
VTKLIGHPPGRCLEIRSLDLAIAIEVKRLKPPDQLALQKLVELHHTPAPSSHDPTPGPPHRQTTTNRVVVISASIPRTHPSLAPPTGEGCSAATRGRRERPKVARR